MFTPFAVNRLQQKLLFNVAQGFSAKGCFLFSHVLIAFSLKPFTHHIIIDAFFFGPFHHRHIHAKITDNCCVHAFSVPLIGIGLWWHIFSDQIINHLKTHITGNFGQVTVFHDVAALTKDHLALLVHHIIELEQLLAHIKVTAFNLCLRALQRFVHPRVFNRFTLFHAKRRQHLVQTFRSKNPHQVIFKGQKEQRPTRITLTPRPTAQLIINPPAFMTFRSQYEQTTSSLNIGLFFSMFCFDLSSNFIWVCVWISGKRVHHLHLNVATKFDISPTTSHVCSDRNRAKSASISNNLSFFFVLAGVQNIMLNPSIR